KHALYHGNVRAKGPRESVGEASRAGHLLCVCFASAALLLLEELMFPFPWVGGPPTPRSAHYARIVLAHIRLPTRVRILTLYSVRICTEHRGWQWISLHSVNGYLSDTTCAYRSGSKRSPTAAHHHPFSLRVLTAPDSPICRGTTAPRPWSQP
ncbi:hypothetical protein CSPX01_07125, partial [Colletotrichum filicis]